MNQKLDGEFATTLLPTDQVLPCFFQSRTETCEIGLDELTRSIEKNGILEPLVVRKTKAGFELVAGDRRLRAAKFAKFRMVPVVVRDVSDEEVIVIQANENLQRNDLSEFEKTRLVSEMAKRLKLDAKEIAEKLHKSYTWVVTYLPSEFKDKEKAQAGSLGGQAKAATSLVAQIEKTVEEAGKIPSATAIHRLVKPGTEEKMGNTFDCSDCRKTVKIGEGKLALNPDRYVCPECYQNLLEICPGCGMPRTDMVKWHSGKLCGVCRPRADNNEGYYEHKISIAKIPKKLQEKLKSRIHKPSIDTYAYRKAQRSPLISKFEDDIQDGLNERQLPMGEQQGLITLHLPFSDRTWNNLPKGVMILRVNGPPHDEPKQKDKDEKICRALEDLGVNVVQIDYKAPSETAKQEALDIIEKNLTEMGWRRGT